MSLVSPYMAEPPPGYERITVNPPSVAPGCVAMGAIVTAVAVLVVGLRIFTRTYIVRGRIGADDYLVIVALAFAIILLGLFTKLTQVGLGNHMWDVLYTNYSPLLLGYTLGGTMTYSLSISFSKLSILVFYLRLSPERYFRILVWGLIAVVICYSIAYQLISLFGCSPVAAGWDLSIMATAKCVDKLTSYMVLSIANIIMDVLTLLLPLPVLIPLQLPRRQKISLFFLFATGALVCAVAIRRTMLLPPLLASADYSWDAIEQFYWCFAEVAGGILCASVPALKPFFVRYLPAIVNSSLRSTSNGPKGVSSNGTKGGMSTVVDRNKERRQAQQQSYELRSQDDMSWDRKRSQHPEDDEAKLWNGNFTSKGSNNKTTTVIVSHTYEGDSSSIDTDQGTDRRGPSVNATATRTNRGPVPPRGINVTQETRVDYN